MPDVEPKSRSRERIPARPRGARAAKRASAAKPPKAAKHTHLFEYERKGGVTGYVSYVVGATPLERVAIERNGVPGAFIKAFSKKLKVPAVRVYKILGVKKATVEKKTSAGQLVKGSGGQAAVGMIRLFGLAQEIVANSTAEGARDFDVAEWLGRWIERPQPALGGRKPAELMDTPTGIEVVARLLGSLESGAYQ